MEESRILSRGFWEVSLARGRDISCCPGGGGGGGDMGRHWETGWEISALMAFLFSVKREARSATNKKVGWPTALFSGRWMEGSQLDYTLQLPREVCKTPMIWLYPRPIKSQSWWWDPGISTFKSSQAILRCNQVWEPGEASTCQTVMCTQIAGSLLTGRFWFRRCGWDLRIHMFSQLPGDVAAVTSGTPHLEL